MNTAFFGVPVWLLAVAAAVLYAALVVCANALAAWRGQPWSPDELRRRQAPLIWLAVGAAGIEALFAAIDGLARVLVLLLP
ncbi:hypothetical protein [Kitasatospora fiedleri]|uniref:hypothetical protein n=1 Tax=Kitasatospora fiedleri TaxID=2991545 RepID=UPI00249CE196|nr:hypothetical protein [Kitasatospora fiedleri]